MTPAVALRCPNCKRPFESHSWHDDSSGECRHCGTSFEFIAFPALTAGAAHVTAQPAELAADSVCFFHPQNRAEAVCEGCGRLLCTVCAVPFMGQKLCPVCIQAATRKESAEVAVRGRVLHDSIALALAVLPLLMFFLTIFTAPVALGWAIYAWNKPGSLVHGRRRWRLVVAALFAVAEIAGWTWFFTVRGRLR
jgi:hypothetical protein